MPYKFFCDRCETEIPEYESVFKIASQKRKERRAEKTINFDAAMSWGEVCQNCHDFLFTVATCRPFPSREKEACDHPGVRLNVDTGVIECVQCNREFPLV